MEVLTGIEGLLLFQVLEGRHLENEGVQANVVAPGTTSKPFGSTKMMCWRSSSISHKMKSGKNWPLAPRRLSRRADAGSSPAQ